MLRDEPPICGAVDEIDYGVWFECELLPGHAGDHRTLHTWQNEPHGPQLPVARQSLVLIPEAWAESVMASWRASLLRHPVR